MGAQTTNEMWGETEKADCGSKAKARQKNGVSDFERIIYLKEKEGKEGGNTLMKGTRKTRRKRGGDVKMTSRKEIEGRDFRFRGRTVECLKKLTDRPA